MSIFTFNSISYKDTNRTGNASGENMGVKREYDIFRYPIDLGNYDKGHYMIFHINTQLASKYAGPEGPDQPTVLSNQKELGTSTPFGAIGGSTPFGTKFLRTIRRTTDTIALYMPDTLNFNYPQQYNEPNLGRGFAAALLSSGLSLADAYKNASDLSRLKNSPEYFKALKNLSPLASWALTSKGGDLGTAAWTALTGTVQNPMIEVIYHSPKLRNFRFDFMFYPRSYSEARMVQQILYKLRFHQSPEIHDQFKGFFLIPPSEFDIKFYYNGTENPNIPKISTCVLENIDIDYAPNGFSAYEMLGAAGSSPVSGGTGMPVAIRLSLQFKETEILTKQYYDSLDKTYQFTEPTSNWSYDMPSGDGGGWVNGYDLPSGSETSGWTNGNDLPSGNEGWTSGSDLPTG